MCLSDVVGLSSHCKKVEDYSFRVEYWITLGDWVLAQGPSPWLDIAEPLQVPLSYCVDGSYVKISKQRPRKIILGGSGGKDYESLLKGCEDL